MQYTQQLCRIPWKREFIETYKVQLTALDKRHKNILILLILRLCIKVRALVMQWKFEYLMVGSLSLINFASCSHFKDFMVDHLKCMRSFMSSLSFLIATPYKACLTCHVRHFNFLNSAHFSAFVNTITEVTFTASLYSFNTALLHKHVWPIVLLPAVPCTLHIFLIQYNAIFTG